MCKSDDNVTFPSVKLNGGNQDSGLRNMLGSDIAYIEHCGEENMCCTSSDVQLT